MKQIILSLILLLVVTACSSTKRNIDKSIGGAPSWFVNLPQDDNYLFAAQTSTSRDLQMAINKSTMDGRASIAQQLETRMQGMQTRFQEEVGLGEGSEILEQFTSAYKAVVEETLVGSRVRTQETVREGQLYRSYVLVEMPIGAANEALVQRIRNSENMYTRFRATQAFQDLEKEVQEYREWREKQ